MYFSDYEDEHFDEMAMRKKQEMQATGRIIVLMIVAVNILLEIFISANIFALLFNVAVAIALYKGERWARFLFQAGAALIPLILMFSFFGSSVEVVTSPFYLVFCIIALIFSFANLYFLSFNKSVKIFLDEQKKRK